ncbi:MAG TPA: molybdopterin-binding protein [Casimicrobiaceae bacterium]
MKLMKRSNGRRRRFLARMLGAAGAATLAGCDRLSQTTWFPALLGKADVLSEGAAAVVGRKAMAQEFPAAERSPTFRSNGTSDPGTEDYEMLVSDGFAGYRLAIDGLVETPRMWTLDELRAMPSRSQITRHDCVEGWSAIGQWKGARLSSLLAAVRPKPAARYAVFHCADPMSADGNDLYYESIDFDDAYHEQTILAYELNGAPLPVKNGAPLRLRVERQLGYKHAKYVMRVELINSFAHIAGGHGGYWEDQGYQWYAGI